MGVYCWTLSTWCTSAAACSNRTSSWSGARSLALGTVIRVLLLDPGISAPQIAAWLIAFLAACSFGYWVTFSERPPLGTAVRIDDDPVTPNGMLLAAGAWPELV